MNFLSGLRKQSGLNTYVVLWLSFSSSKVCKFPSIATVILYISLPSLDLRIKENVEIGRVISVLLLQVSTVGITFRDFAYLSSSTLTKDFQLDFVT